MRITAAAVFLFVASTLELFAQAPPLINDDVKKLAAGYPGVAIAVADGDRTEIVTLGAVDRDSIFEIGSVTKTFTSLLLADAVTRGEVTLDTPVEKLLPGFTIPKAGDRAITLLDLATHRSGLPRLPDNMKQKDAKNPYADYSAADLKAFLAQHKLAFAPGEHFEYSNLGAGLLGYALAQRAGTTYEKLVHDRIFVPLAMHDTTITLTPKQKEHFAAGHTADGAAQIPWDLDALAGAGAIRSTAGDMLKYVRAFMQPSGPLAKAIALAVTPQRDAGNQRIALAWLIDASRGRAVVWHNGQTGGFSSFAGFTADGKRGAVVLTNIARGVEEIGFRALLPNAKNPNEDYTGRYRLSPQFELTVTPATGGITVQGTGQPPFPAVPTSKDEFQCQGVDARISFHRDASGKVDSLTLHQNGQDVPGPRVGDPIVRKEIAIAPAALEAYVGTYALAPTFALNVVAENGQLFVQATQQPRFPVFASGPDEFFYKVVDAQLTFKRNAEGKVTSVVLHQNGRDIEGAKQ